MKNLSVPILYGIYVAIGLIGYFLLISIFGAHTNPVFSLFNGVIVGAGIYLSIKRESKDEGDKFKYENGFTTGLTTGFLATAIFTAFFAIYASHLDEDFLEELITMWLVEYGANLGMVLFTVALMGFATTVVLTLTFMQIFKKTANTEEGRKHTY
ncbi:MAG TPA: DUF4199 domain-containing protein [Salinimicrobium sp.]|nr:DUF4199 domain-containing protein [Salinimicrobium sp.]